MISIFDMNLDYLKIKEGDIKVNSQDMKALFQLLESYHQILCNSLQDLSAEEQETVNNGLSMVELLQNKYIVLGSLRFEQKKWYEMLKLITEKNIPGIEKYSDEEVETLRQEVFNIYVETKQKRERLAKELNDS